MSPGFRLSPAEKGFALAEALLQPLAAEVADLREPLGEDDSASRANIAEERSSSRDSSRAASSRAPLMDASNCCSAAST